MSGKKTGCSHYVIMLLCVVIILLSYTNIMLYILRYKHRAIHEVDISRKYPQSLSKINRKMTSSYSGYLKINAQQEKVNINV